MKTALRTYFAEFVGTFIYVFFALLQNSAGSIAGGLVGSDGAVIDGLGVTLAIYCTGYISGAHLNPAVTIALAAWASFPWSNVVGYIAAQFIGALCAAGLNYGLYSSTVSRYEELNGIVRGSPGSERTAMIFGEYFPNPASYIIPAGASPEILATLQAHVTPGLAFASECVGTAILMLIILCLIDKKNASISPPLIPLFIGATVFAIVAVLAPISQAGLNPTRDFAPRLVALAAGWGKIAIPGPQNGFWVYIVGPIVGAQVGAAFHYVLFKFGVNDEFALPSGRVEDEHHELKSV
ncbi:putative glycerol uptake facilitator protein [Rhizoclosmatium globosum]|uniref:Putative glycerol uptake facilitator protein n=1 Tax=Rhizoclosmatium globosum TaxID=329046 RepID=A0A1Y2CDN8_9FUNG|nr:putative glycerol uptake facilitator protein [Rhizoclosmatium globosum]|eukprot:ORY45159.1 putative glycerol uptake facilitator protein [Rhizoclosmatium globosum]